MARSLEVVDTDNRTKKQIGRITFSPWEDRVTLAISSKMVRSKREALILLATHVMDTIESSMTLRGRIQLIQNSLQTTLCNRNKAVAKEYILDLEDLQFKTRSEFETK